MERLQKEERRLDRITAAAESLSRLRPLIEAVNDSFVACWLEGAALGGSAGS